MDKKSIGILTAGLCAGAVNGIFGAGGGMVLVPLLSLIGQLEEDELFPCSVSMILPICIITLGFCIYKGESHWQAALPYVLGSAIGGVAAGIWGKRIPTIWLHRALGAFILWGGIRYIC